MKRYVSIACMLCLFLVHTQILAGTLRLENGEVLEFNNEKEFVEILLEEFLPPDFSGETGYFIVSDSSSEKESLQILLVHPEELDIHEYLETNLYPSIEALIASQEYKETVATQEQAYTFAVEVSVEEFDMTFVYALDEIDPNIKTRSLPDEGGVRAIIDARGEGHFEFIEE